METFNRIRSGELCPNSTCLQIIFGDRDTDCYLLSTQVGRNQG